jgi:hypothetical protein
MQRESLKRYRTAFTTIAIIIASIGVILPGYSYFTMFSPPFWDGSSIITAALAAFVIIYIFFLKPPTKVQNNSKNKPLIRKSAIAICLSMVFLIFYLALLAYCTVVESDTKNRYQIGFGKWERGLTDEGKDVKKSHPEQTVDDWMANDALFRRNGPAKIWTIESIIISGVCMIIIFLITFVSWTYGWSLLAKHIALGRGNILLPEQVNPDNASANNNNPA